MSKRFLEEERKEEEEQERPEALAERIRKRNEEGRRMVEKMLQHSLTEEELQEFIRKTQESQESLQQLIKLGLELPEGEGRRRRRMEKR